MQHINEAKQAFTELVYDSVVVQLFKDWLIKEPSTQMLMTYLSVREFAQFMSDNIGEALINNVAQEK